MADDMIRTTCPALTCGVPFEFPQYIWNQVRSRGKDRVIYCPNGHEVAWAETNEDRLRRQVESLTRERDILQDRVERHLKTARYWQGIAHRKPRAR